MNNTHFPFFFVFRTIQNFIIPQNQEVAADRQFIASHLDKDSSVASVFSFSVNVIGGNDLLTMRL